MIITFMDIKKINDRVVEKGLGYKIHLSDRCGSQSMWIENFKGEHEVVEEALYAVINAYFSELKVELEYSWDKKSFWSKDRSLIF